MRDIADYLVGGYADATFPDNLRIFHYGDCPVLKGPITVKVQYNKHGEYLGTTGNISIASGETKTFCLEDYVPYDGIPGNALVIWLVGEGEPAPEPSPEPTPPAPTGDIPSAFQPYVVDISGLSASQEVSWKGVPVLIWWGEGSVTLKGPIKIAEQHATKAGEQISWDEYIIEAGQTRTFSNVSGQDMSIYLLEAEAELNYPCPYCDATFDTQGELDEHIRTEHPEVPPVEGKIIGVGINEGRGGISWSPDERHLGYNELSEAGLNTICSLWLGKEFVNKVHNYGFKVIGFGAGTDFASVYEQSDWRTDEGCEYVWLDELISTIGLTESQYNQIRNHCHSKNPNVKVLICEVNPFTLEQVKNWPYCDGIMVQQYPGNYTDSQGRETRIAWMEAYRRTHPNQTVLAWITMEKTMDGVSPSQVRDDTIRHLNSEIDGIVYFIFRSRGECYWEEAKEAVREVTGGGPTIPTYPCPHCPAVFDTQAELDAHIASEHPEEPPPPLVSGIHFMFGVDPGSDFKRVRDAEVNLIHDYGYMGGRSYLDKAQAAGLYVLYNLKDLIHDRIRDFWNNPAQQWSIWNNSKDEVRARINEVKGHPALYGYYVLTEPNLELGAVQHDLQQDIYNFVKSIDPNSKVAFDIAGGPGGRGYTSINWNALDFVIPDYYIYDNGGRLGDLESVCSHLRAYFDEHGISIPVVWAVQACNGGTGYQGHIRDQIDVVLKYNLATGGIGMWAWNLADGAKTSDRTLNEVRDAWGASTWEPPPAPPPVYTCPHCGATFSSQGELNSHIESEHPTEPPPNGYGPDVCTGGIATADRYEAGHPPSHAFDDNSGTYWGTWPVHSFPHWIKYELPSAKVVEKYTIRAGIWDEAPRNWTFQGSNDGSAWAILDTRVNITGWGGQPFKVFTFSNTTAYRYYKLNITANNGGHAGGFANEIEMMERLEAYTCPHCGATFGSQAELNDHIETEHPGLPPAAEVPWYEKYAPHLIIGGAIAAIIAYLTLRKRG